MWDRREQKISLLSIYDYLGVDWTLSYTEIQSFFLQVLMYLMFWECDKGVRWERTVIFSCLGHCQELSTHLESHGPSPEHLWWWLSQCDTLVLYFLCFLHVHTWLLSMSAAVLYLALSRLKYLYFYYKLAFFYFFLTLLLGNYIDFWKPVCRWVISSRNFIS